MFNGSAAATAVKAKAAMRARCMEWTQRCRFQDGYSLVIVEDRLSARWQQLTVSFRQIQTDGATLERHSHTATWSIVEQDERRHGAVRMHGAAVPRSVIDAGRVRVVGHDVEVRLDTQL